MSKEQITLANRLDDLKFEIERSIQYCDYRLFFWQSMSKTAQIISAFTSSAAFILLFQNKIEMTLTCIAITATVTILVSVLDAAKNASHNIGKKSKFTKLLIKIPVIYDKVTEKQYKIWYAERLRIDDDESTNFQCLSVICHNDICLRKGINDIYPLSSFQRTIGKYFPIRYRNIKEEVVSKNRLTILMMIARIIYLIISKPIAAFQRFTIWLLGLKENDIVDNENTINSDVEYTRIEPLKKKFNIFVVFIKVISTVIILAWLLIVTAIFPTYKIISKPVATFQKFTVWLWSSKENDSDDSENTFIDQNAWEVPSPETDGEVSPTDSVEETPSEAADIGIGHSPK